MIFKIIIVLMIAGIWSHPVNKAGLEAEHFSEDVELREGDMLFRKDQTRSLASEAPGILWPNGVMPYTIVTSSYTTAQVQIIKDAMALLTSKTDSCVSFVERTTEANYIEISKKDGCYSYVGMLSIGKQEVSIGSGCEYKGTVVHELMHALGYMHEQNRADRDTYITVNLDNVETSAQSQFDKYPAGLYYNTPYDLLSIMQYASYSFSKNGQMTIIPKDTSVTLVAAYDKTDAQIMTDYDISAVKTRYSCSASTSASTSATTSATTSAASCTNADATCIYYADNASTYCSQTNSYKLGGVAFRDACKMMCGACTNQPVTVAPTCVDEWFCGIYSAESTKYCSTTGTTYSINGKQYATSCPNVCKTGCAA